MPERLKLLQAAGLELQYIDVREFGEGPNAPELAGLQMPVNELASHIHLADPALPTLVYCLSGKRSLAAAKELQEVHRFTELRSLRGGVYRWLELDGPLKVEDFSGACCSIPAPASEAPKPKKKPKKVLQEGPISAEFIGQSIAKHQTKTSIGAHDIFLGQVRADVIEDKTVQGIFYTAFEEMAELEFTKIREAAFEQFDLTCMHIYHSLGRVNAGEICLFVFTSAPHRKAAGDACRFVVEAIKANVPIFGRELFDDQSYQWKKNTPEHAAD